MREAVQNLIKEEEDGGPEVGASHQAVIQQSQWHDQRKPYVQSSRPVLLTVMPKKSNDYVAE